MGKILRLAVVSGVDYENLITDAGYHGPVGAKKPGYLLEGYKEMVRRFPHLISGIQIVKTPFYGICDSANASRDEDVVCSGMMGLLQNGTIDASVSLVISC